MSFMMCSSCYTLNPSLILFPHCPFPQQSVPSLRNKQIMRDFPFRYMAGYISEFKTY